MLKAVCKNAKNRPNEIPLSKWIEKDKEYTIIAVCQSKTTGDMYYKLEEVQPPAPYGGYNIDRFEVDWSTILELVELDVIEVL